MLLKEDDELIREVFDYWTRKRKTSKSAALLSAVKQEKRDGSSTNDPYVAFRRRTEKMQTRKVPHLQGLEACREGLMPTPSRSVSANWRRPSSSGVRLL